MPAQDQLEIIDPQGRIRFYPLDPAQGITNIGRHIDNDIVINRHGVAPFHAMLDHRAKPFQVIVLARSEKTLLDGQPAPINVPTPLTHWASLEIGGHQIIYLTGEEEEKTEEPAAPVDAVAEAPASPAAVPVTSPPAEAAGQPAASSTQTPTQTQSPPDPTAALAVEYSTRSVAVDPGHTVTVDLVIANGGYKPLSFAAAVEGLDPTWVTITPPQIEVPARQRSTATITIAPPHQPSTHAGAHGAAITVTTPDFPDWKNQSRLAVTVNSYAGFVVSELSPRVQTLFWGKPFAQASFEVTHRGNSEMAFRITGEDERYACRYEFILPNDPVAQSRQAELRLAPGQGEPVSVRVTPFTRHRVGLGPRRHFFTVTVAPQGQGGQPIPRSVLGEVSEQPRIGPVAFALAAIVLISLALVAFRPTIAMFAASPTHIQAGQEVTLAWSASPFASLRINPDVGVVPGPDGRKTITPTKDTTYTLVAESFLSWINPKWFRAAKEVAVLVDPVLPAILLTTDRDTITSGESVTLTWQVLYADELILTVNGIPDPIPAGQHTDSRTVQLTEDTVFVLQARNKFTTADGVTASIAIKVTPATPVPRATESTPPVVDRFEVSPSEITAGQPVTIYWAVSGVDKVNIDPIPGDFPPVGNIVQTPQQTTAYVLTASNGNTPVKLVKQVVVNPAPGAPRVESFTAAPTEVAPGSPESTNIKLAWLVTGEATDIQLAGPGLGPAVNLPKQGELTVSVETTSTFTLTAFNGSLSTQQTVQVKVSSPAPQVISLAPSTAVAGGAAFALSVTGSGFVNGSVAQWNGSPRSTTYVSPTQLLAAISSADVASAGTANVTVFNPAPGGGVSSALQFTSNNPAPLISSIAPNTAMAGGPAFALVINGSGFNTQTIVRWNGSPRTVSSVTPGQITVLISAADIASPGTATISVVNPIPGGGSDATVFTINAPTATFTPTFTPTATATPTETPTPTPTATP